MLDLETYFAYARKCNDVGIKCFSVINGTQVQTPQMAERMMCEGPSEITISINSHRAEVHDRTRGVKGALDMVIKCFTLLLEARRKLNVVKPVNGMVLVCEQNYRELDDLYDLILNKIGADKLKLNFLQPTFSKETAATDDSFFDDNVVKDYKGLRQIIEHCGQQYGLQFNPVWLHQVEMYHHSVANNPRRRLGWCQTKGTEEPICNSYDRNIMIDLYGNAQLCFNCIYKSFPIRHRGDLHDFWYNWSLPMRRKMVGCRRYCGISHSVRNTESTLKPNAAGVSEAPVWPPSNRGGLYRRLSDWSGEVLDTLRTITRQ
jgi:MoaA/NifB/PqqE/SkfB family radical SAM enzyme